MSAGAEEWQLPDPDELADELHLFGFHTGTAFDAAWHHAIAFTIEPEQQERNRMRMILELARYGRFGGGIHDWDDEPVRELRSWWGVLKEILDNENAISRTAEDR